ncbi:MAG: outer membrane lipoprotein-sorting protein [Deinococcota bacterium]
MKLTLRTLVMSLLTISLLTANAQAPSDHETILQNIDVNSRFPADMTATVTLEEQDPNEGDELFTVRMFRRDVDDKFLLLFELPEVQLGQGYLNIEDGLWFYDPESRQFTYTSLSESFSGTDARNSDFQASDMAGDYDVVSFEEGTLGNFEVWILELEATNDEVTYPYRKVWVSREPNLILKSEDYSLNQRLLRTSYFPSYARAGESYIADQQLYVDALVEGKSTQLTIENISTAEIPNNVFTKAYVERVNR